MEFKAQRGTTDILPKDQFIWNFVQNKCFEVAKSFGYRYIETPIFEDSRIFERTVGEDTDIVEKEMYSFVDKGGENISLRPENTAGVCRAFIENGLYNDTLPSRLFYYGPMFRYERPQAGRFRQFHQFGVECIGDSSHDNDFEVIKLAWNILSNLEISDIELNINSLGDKEDRDIYVSKLVDYFGKYSNDLPKVDKLRLERAPLRLLDSKEKITINISEDAPKTIDYISKDSKSHHDKIIENLENLRKNEKTFKYKVNNKLVRGLDYYNRTVFEYISDSSGPQGVLLGGGRYDPLIKILGGPDTPAVGFAMGFERIVTEVSKQDLIKTNNLDIVIVVLKDEYRTNAEITSDLFRRNKISTIIAPRRSLKGQLRFANNLNAKLAVILGEEEIKNNSITIKFLNSRDSQIELSNEDILKIKSLLTSED
ncbi:MAG: histidine--tRNA ligase [Chloroflexota bacterium]|nr:histidine--tRNA ligase [Chloroflexota bacterium]